MLPKLYTEEHSTKFSFPFAGKGLSFILSMGRMYTPGVYMRSTQKSLYVYIWVCEHHV